MLVAKDLRYTPWAPSFIRVDKGEYLQNSISQCWAHSVIYYVIVKITADRTPNHGMQSREGFVREAENCVEIPQLCWDVENQVRKMC